MNHAIVLIESHDAKGLVHKISGVLFNHGLNIERNDEFVDKENNRFFMRTEIIGQVDHLRLIAELREQLPEDSSVRVVDASQKKRVAILVTKESHCIGDILIRDFSGELHANIVGVIGNHATLEPLVAKFGHPFVHIPAEGLDRDAHEEKILAQLDAWQPDLIVLAKYMRVLTPRFVAAWEGRIINIHHSFLPAFIGANPYKQAYERGVKIIGATAHFVNNNLDEGPIIAQDIIRVNHTHGWEDMRHAGRDVEKVVLARALKLVLEDRIFIYNNKTIIFE
ncbi:MAG: formyltetrahydrofolate deformylase [Campylobacterales bacterium]